jgi:hypothetical protein
MTKAPSERLDQLVRLLTDITGHPDPDSKVHKSPLLPEEKSMEPTVGILAARYREFNAQGLGFDIPGTADWPNIIRVGIGGREVGAAALESFFGLSRGLADRVMKERPSPDLLDTLSRYLADQNSPLEVAEASRREA